jgi:hypothetical protein
MRGWEQAHTYSQEQSAVGRGAGRWRSRLTLVVVLGLIGALISAAAPGAAQAAGPSWSVVPSVNQTGPEYGDLSSISCVSASSCFAVGLWTTAPVSSLAGYHTLAESWNGSAWTVVPSPDKGTVGSALTGVSCVSASDCLAVGYFFTGPTYSPSSTPLAETWNGKTWSIVANPETVGQLQAVSCVSASSCTAVGTGPEGTLIESWNGSAWSVVPSPDTGSGDTLHGVSCPAAGSCVAVGSYAAGTGITATLVESWNGKTWSIVSSPNSGVYGSQLAGVSCISASSCTAVGDNRTSPETTLVESWNGSTWSVVSSPNQGDDSSQLAAVSCVSASSCTAVGTYQAYDQSNDSFYQQTLAESWNGSTWSVVSSPDQGSDWDNELAAVTCRSASSCTTVGYYDYQGEYAQTLLESWNGSTLSVGTSANYVTSTDALSGVSCVSASFCVAVGSYLDTAHVSRTLIESWNGTTWSLVTSPNKFSNDNVLTSVSCVSAKFCVAVGSWADARATLVESWNGSTWSVVPSPSTSSIDQQLDGVSCVSASFCVADGFTSNATLVESWNGSKWSIVSSPNPASIQNLDGVSCASASFCVAVGFYVVPSDEAPRQTLVESWNGSAWSIVSSPDESSNSNVLSGVTCLSATSCTAVGSYYTASKVLQTLAESWNGSAWSVVSSPNQGTANNALLGVSCAATSSCAGVGYYRTGSSTLAESWNGTAWSVVPSPSPGTHLNELPDVSCVSTVSCTAVGYLSSESTGDQYSLIERLS